MSRSTVRNTSRRTDPSALFTLAAFRYRVRRFLRFSERMARSCGITPQQHQLLLGVAGYTGRNWATISELAEFLQSRHNAVVGLVQRASNHGLVRKAQNKKDRRVMRVYLTRKGAVLLDRISRQNLTEFRALQREMLHPPRLRDIPATQGI